MSEESVTTTSSTYITADGRKVRKVKKKKVTIEESSLNGSRRESEVEISEISSTLNSDSTSNQNVDSNPPAITQGNTKQELVLDESRTKAMDADWHEKHFSCWQCDDNLTAKKYVLRDDKSYCIKCFESNFSSTCDACRKIIGIDSKDLAYKEKHWHEACFLCSQCSLSLVDKNFGSKGDKLYCSNCYDIQFSTKCEGCGDIFRSGSKKVEYKGQVFHDQCFLCVNCKTPIGSKSFVPRGTETFCVECYEEKFANRCCKCSKTITGNGLSFRDENWHKECFTCLNCNTQLFGAKFTTKNDKPYCAECFGNLFAKKCTRCTKGIIPGGSGSRFISFEDRNWHNDCFVCSGCTTSLIGKGFIADGPDILCAECARQRLA